jgi:hypothetical protein
MTIIEAAADLGQLRREDALAVLVVMAEKSDPRFERAAARFAARVIIERRLSPADGRRVLALAGVAAGVGDDADPAARPVRGG